jgi:hypothetical protein
MLRQPSDLPPGSGPFQVLAIYPAVTVPLSAGKDALHGEVNGLKGQNTQAAPRILPWS